MSLQLAAELWYAVRELVQADEVGRAAEVVVGLLIENGFDLDDIQHEFGGDPEISSAVNYYNDGFGDSDEDILEEKLDSMYDEDGEWQ